MAAADALEVDTNGARVFEPLNLLRVVIIVSNLYLSFLRRREDWGWRYVRMTCIVQSNLMNNSIASRTRACVASLQIPTGENGKSSVKGTNASRRHKSDEYAGRQTR